MSEDDAVFRTCDNCNIVFETVGDCQRHDCKDIEIGNLEKENERLRATAEYLWKIIDDIDTATDAYKPEHDPFVRKVYSLVGLRFRDITSDGYKLVWKETP